MSKNEKTLFRKIKAMSNYNRFRILELTENNPTSITRLSSSLKLSYNKGVDYGRLLEDLELVSKTKVGKDVKIESRVKFK